MRLYLTPIDYYIYIYILGSEHHRVYIPYIARIHRCKRLWCSIMDALTWGGGLVVRSVAEESVGVLVVFVWGRRNWRRSFLTTLRVGGFCRLFVR